jgi:hypothetical protein
MNAPLKKTEVLERICDELDFSIECEVDVLIMRHGVSTGVYTDKCTKRAAWLGVAPCGHDAYFCEEHHYDTRAFHCHHCGRANMMLATYRWMRL